MGTIYQKTEAPDGTILFSPRDERVSPASPCEGIPSPGGTRDMCGLVFKRSDGHIKIVTFDHLTRTLRVMDNIGTVEFQEIYPPPPKTMHAASRVYLAIFGSMPTSATLNLFQQRLMTIAE